VEVVGKVVGPPVSGALKPQVTQVHIA